MLLFLQFEQIHVPQCICVSAACRNNYGSGRKKRLASNRTSIEVFFSHSRSKSLVPEGNGIDIDDCGLPPSPLPPAVWLVVKIVNVCKQMQTGTGKCFDLVHMCVCVCVSVVGLRYGDFIWFYLLLWFAGKAQTLTSQFESHWAARGEFGSSCATPTRSCSKWSLTLSLWRCFSLTHAHTKIDTRTPDGKAALTGVD